MLLAVAILALHPSLLRMYVPEDGSAWGGSFRNYQGGPSLTAACHPERRVDGVDPQSRDLTLEALVQFASGNCWQLPPLRPDLVGPPADISPLLIRRSQVNITPPEPLPLGGYTGRGNKLMEAGGDPLYARCIELEQGDTKLAIVSVEMLTVPESLYREVVKRIPKNVHLFLQATHTHCAPDSQMLNDRMTFTVPGIASYKRRWLTWYADRIASSVLNAEKATAVKPPMLGTVSFLTGANRSRRPRGKPDSTVTWIEAPPPAVNSFSSGNTSLLFAHFSAHPIIYDEHEQRTRGDWPGRLSARWGAPILNGAIGDVSPSADGATADLRLADFFAKLARGYKEHPGKWVSVWKPGWRGLRVLNEAIPLDAKKPHPGFVKDYGLTDELAQSLMDQFAPSSAEIEAFRLGDLVVVGIPGEPTSILGNQIKAAGQKMGFKTVLICSHVNGWMGYILDPLDYDEGEYEATLSFYGRQQGPKVVSAAIAAMTKLR
jgi:neutral ceramidase